MPKKEVVRDDGRRICLGYFIKISQICRKEGEISSSQNVTKNWLLGEADITAGGPLQKLTFNENHLVPFYIKTVLPFLLKYLSTNVLYICTHCTLYSLT
jgi:hypothetical protein